VGLDDPGPIDDQRVGDDAVERLGVARSGHLPHPIAEHFAAAELAFVAVDCVVALHLGDQIGVAENQPISSSGPEHVRIMTAAERLAHGSSFLSPKPLAFTRPIAPALFCSVTGPSASALPPRAMRAPAKATS